MDFIPHDTDSIKEMLKEIGIENLEDLFKDIPESLKIKDVNIPSGLSESDLANKLEIISTKNLIYPTSFLGAGCYYHYIPSIIDFIISRPEFYTAYTPYQAEASQGMLQALYEYQSAITRLTEMDVTNASMYDGSTALAEALIVATIITGKNKIILHEGIHPEYIEVAKTYAWGYDMDIKILSTENIIPRIDDNIAAVVIQSPNFFGEIEDLETIIKGIKHRFEKCLVIQVMTDPTCLGLLKPPGKLDVDIFVAEGQSFGIMPSFGGPGLGIFTLKEKYMRKIPGRLIGKTMELKGDKEGFILTLQAREQHIRREKASSNICTNQSLCSLAALIYLVALGKSGLREVALQNIQKSNYVKQMLSDLNGFEILNKKPTYNEFIVKCDNLEGFLRECKQLNLLPPLKLSRYYPEMKDIALVCVTEMNSKQDIQKLLQAANNTTNKLK